MNQMKTITLSIALALVSGGAFAATHALATDTNSGSKIAVTFDSSVADNFGSMDQSVPMITDEAKAVGALAHFFGPAAKQVLVRKYAEYDALKQVAVAAKVTTPERIASTQVIVVPELAQMFGIDNIDQYGLDRGLVSTDERAVGGLAYNDKLLTTVFKDITTRAASGELKPISSIPSKELA